MCFHWFQPFKSRLVCWIYVWWPFGSTRGTREGWEKAYLFKIELHFHFPTLNRFENWWWFCLNQIDFVSPSPGWFLPVTVTGEWSLPQPHPPPASLSHCGAFCCIFSSTVHWRCVGMHKRLSGPLLLVGWAQTTLLRHHYKGHIIAKPKVMFLSWSSFLHVMNQTKIREQNWHSGFESYLFTKIHTWIEY